VRPRSYRHLRHRPARRRRATRPVRPDAPAVGRRPWSTVVSGPPIRAADAVVGKRIRKIGAQGLVDIGAAIAVWETILATQDWAGAPVWIHADLYPTNLLATHGWLSAVIDFGELGVGDPACDMLPAWALLDGRARALFHGEVDVDDATWERGRGWALALGVGAVDVYQKSNPVLAAMGRRSIAEVLTER
jgi:aminoglycoside phosphotransferase (APT) family kinase protein